MATEGGVMKMYIVGMVSTIQIIIHILTHQTYLVNQNHYVVIIIPTIFPFNTPRRVIIIITTTMFINDAIYDQEMNCY